MAENYECIDDPKSGVNAPPPVPPPAPPPMPAPTNPEPAPSKRTGSQLNVPPPGNSQTKPPPPLNEKPSQERSQEAIPAAPRLVGNPLSGGELRKNQHKKKGCCTIL
uniref:WH2 domain-containing protein n=1 Tax=Strongyloides papillosus TaxID=174720 RepID=A0A0N5B4D9_STREA